MDAEARIYLHPACDDFVVVDIIGVVPEGHRRSKNIDREDLPKLLHSLVDQGAVERGHTVTTTVKLHRLEALTVGVAGRHDPQPPQSEHY